MIKLDRTLTYRLHLLHKLTDLESSAACISAVAAMSVIGLVPDWQGWRPLSGNCRRSQTALRSQ